MSELSPRINEQRLPVVLEQGALRQIGDLSLTEQVKVAAGDGSNKEGHGSGYYS